MGKECGGDKEKASARMEDGGWKILGND